MRAPIPAPIPAQARLAASIIIPAEAASAPVNEGRSGLESGTTVYAIGCESGRVNRGSCASDGNWPSARIAANEVRTRPS
jgi:hypothetical protein